MATTNAPCPRCNRVNPSDATHCAACQADLRLAADLAGLSRRLERLEAAMATLMATVQVAPESEPAGTVADQVAAPDPAPGSATAHEPGPGPALVTDPGPGRPMPIAAPAAQGRPAPAPDPEAAPGRPGPPPDSGPGWNLPLAWRQSEFWLNKVGIGLLLLSLALLFKFAVDQGWLTPAVRIGIGLAIGTGLLGLGYRLRPKRAAFAEVLLGGGIGAYYITGFAAFQLFQLAPYPVALGFMALVTLLAIVMSLRLDEASLTLIGGAGGLATPFLLYTGEGNLAGLAGYTSLVLAGLGAIYFHRGWRLAHWLAVGGGWLIWVIAFVQVNAEGASRPERWALQVGVLFSLVIFWLLPVARRVVTARTPERWRPLQLGLADRWLGQPFQDLGALDIYPLILFNPFLALIGAWALWEPTGRQLGGLSLAGAVVFSLAGWFLARWRAPDELPYTHLLTALGLFTFGLTGLLEGDALFLALALEATALIVLGTRVERGLLRGLGHLLFLVLGLVFVARLFAGAAPRRVWNAQALTDLAVMGLALVPGLYRRGWEGRIYQLAVAGALLGWLSRELRSDWRFLAWALEGAALHGLAVWRRRRDLHWAGDGVALLVGSALVLRLSATGLSPPLFNRPALIDLVTLGLLAALAGTRGSPARPVYRGAAHLALLAWFVRELASLTNGLALISTAWGLYGALLLIIALYWDRTWLNIVALGTLALVVAKLLLVDLAAVHPFWRILLFFGFGAAFLILSYFYRAIWRRPGARAAR